MSDPQCPLPLLVIAMVSESVIHCIDKIQKYRKFNLIKIVSNKLKINK